MSACDVDLLCENINFCSLVVLFLFLTLFILSSYALSELSSPLFPATYHLPNTFFHLLFQIFFPILSCCFLFIQWLLLTWFFSSLLPLLIFLLFCRFLSYAFFYSLSFSSSLFFQFSYFRVVYVIFRLFLVSLFVSIFSSTRVTRTAPARKDCDLQSFAAIQVYSWRFVVLQEIGHEMRHW